jgi:hypothetical protein
MNHDILWGDQLFKKILMFHGECTFPNMMQILLFLPGFPRVMQYPSKFQKICYGAQRIYGIFLKR